MFRKSLFITCLLMLLPAVALAGEIKTDVIYPKSATAVAAGKGNVALWIEDTRENKVFGRAVDGEYLVPGSDLAASLYAYMVSSLKEAGYQVVPYSSELANGMLIHIQSITYTATREMIKSKVEVSVALEAKMNSSRVTRTYRAAVEDQFALSPSAADNGSMIGNGLATAAASILADIAVSPQTGEEASGQ
ncbi:MAG: hypothetical protein CO187_04055 [Zetaproteobacteria bacterium CG_4_9_14_3_um_filter_53_7]|nr:MAG: hypothetical protein CO187_04055 [Zetaproteobacteria bacterium CG_4_9_14_3_um_filter_53_7]